MREEIIKMAREAGMVQDYDCFFSPGDQDMDVHITHLERFFHIDRKSTRLNSSHT